MKKNQTKIIAINAVSGGGKTWTSDALIKGLPKAKGLCFDDRDYGQLSGITDLVKWELEDGADHRSNYNS